MKYCPAALYETIQSNIPLKNEMHNALPSRGVGCMCVGVGVTENRERETDGWRKRKMTDAINRVLIRVNPSSSIRSLLRELVLLHLIYIYTLLTPSSIPTPLPIQYRHRPHPTPPTFYVGASSQKAGRYDNYDHTIGLQVCQVPLQEVFCLC